MCSSQQDFATTITFTNYLTTTIHIMPNTKTVHVAHLGGIDAAYVYNSTLLGVLR